MGTVLMWVLVGLLLLGLVALGGVLLLVVRQQGGLLLRLEALEAARPSPAETADREPIGLAPGTILDPFRLPDVTGRLWTLEDIPGRRLLVNWNPACGFCGQIADDLGRLEAELRRHGTRLVLIGWGDVESNRRFVEDRPGLAPARLLLQDGSPPLRAFAGLGTPVAYLLDEAGAVERLAVGAPDVLDLARGAATGRRSRTFGRPVALGESRVERGGLKAGTPAPTFTLPDLSGTPVSLESFRGRPLLLVFSDPACGPCNAVADDLAALEAARRDDVLQVLVVSRGDAEENRRKARDHGLTGPIVLQEGWRLSRRYGIFETPVAFLIDADGIVTHDVARGREQILALAATRESAAEEVVPRDLARHV